MNTTVQHVVSREWRECVVVTLAAFAVVCGTCIWIDNVHIGTMNGLWKSTLVNEWKHAPATARLDPSNYLYFPLEGLLCRILDLIGVYPDRTWKQLAVVSNVFGALSTGLIFWFVLHTTKQIAAAVAAAVLHAGAGFVLELSISNEDIMPGYFCILLSMLLAARWFAKPTVKQVLVVGVVFSIGWLIEWRLIFPTLPAFVLALAISDSPLPRRISAVCMLMVAILGTTLLAATLWSGHTGKVGLTGLLWTGKGVDSGWGGFSRDKWTLLAVGMGEYLLGGNELSTPAGISEGMPDWSTGLVVEGLLGVAVTLLLWRHRREATWRAGGAVLLGTLVAGQVFNLYAQPQDPQMQINVMAWLSIAWGLCLSRLLSRTDVVKWGIAIVASTLPLIHNTYGFSLLRGQDSREQALLNDLEHNLDLSRTVFFYQGWENITAWEYVTWSQRWEGVCDLSNAPVAVPKFKWINITGGAVHHPNWTGAQHANWLRQQLNCALDNGYAVVASQIWKSSEEELSGVLMSLNARDRAPAIYALITDPHYSATPIPELPGYFRIERH